MKCHACGADIVPEDIVPVERMVASDCQPVRANLRLGSCSSCGLVQKEISQTWQDSCDSIYANYRIYHQSAGVEQKSKSQDGQFGPRSALLSMFLRKHAGLPSAGAVLDIGCGNGAFLRQFRDHFVDWRIAGAELNTSFAEDIRAIAPDATFLTLGELAAFSGKFDLITLIHCLEHIPDPVAYLDNLRRLMDGDGLLLVEVPDAQKNPFDLLIADHASHFSISALRCIVEAAGFDVLICGNNVLGKEITLLARRAERPARKPVADGGTADFLPSHMAWLDRVRGAAEQLARRQAIGVFGSSIAGSWIAAHLDKRLAFFVDEDEARVGRSHMGVPIVAPDNMPRGSVVFICLEPRLASQIREKHADKGAELIAAPIVE